MPLPLPSLDSRTYAELVAEGKAMIPRLAPTWTDHNVHDPGITLIELFAWLAEMDIYRLDRTTDESRRAFLRLIGIEMRPAQVAETVVTFTLAPGPSGPS
jgi:predicted phage baseplate assembly protein